MTTTVVDSKCSEEIEQELLAHRQGRWAGRELSFLCPSHNERHPSASWNSEKLVWHCFSCGDGGGFRHLIEILGMSVADSPPRFSPNSQPLVHPPTFRLDWRTLSNELWNLGEERYLHSWRVFQASQGLDISNWTADELDLALNIVFDAIQGDEVVVALSDLDFNLRSYGLEEKERQCHERQHSKIN